MILCLAVHQNIELGHFLNKAAPKSWEIQRFRALQTSELFKNQQDQMCPYNYVVTITKDLFRTVSEQLKFDSNLRYQLPCNNKYMTYANVCNVLDHHHAVFGGPIDPSGPEWNVENTTTRIVDENKEVCLIAALNSTTVTISS